MTYGRIPNCPLCLLIDVGVNVDCIDNVHVVHSFPFHQHWDDQSSNTSRRSSVYTVDKAEIKLESQRELYKFVRVELYKYSIVKHNKSVGYSLSKMSSVLSQVLG